MNLVFMADGYARASGKPGVILITPGPGLGNIVSGCMEAYSDDVPLLIIHIDIDRREEGKGILHEIAGPENIFRHFIKGYFAPRKPGTFAHILEKALRTCMSGRKGPVLLSIPYSLLDTNTLENRSDDPFCENALHVEATNCAENCNTFMADLEDIIEHKRRPLILGGKGLMEPRAAESLEEICMTSNIPLLTTTGGKGIVSDRYVFSFGNVIKKGVTRQIIESSDLVIATGTRLRDVDVKRRGVRFGDLVHIDIDNRWLNKNYRSILALVGDPPAALGGLVGLLRKKRFSWDMEDLKDKQRSEEAILKGSSDGYRLIELLRTSIPEETTVVCDLNIPSYWAEYYMPVYHQRSFIMPRGVSPIFYSLSDAIGAKTAQPERPCLAVCGDGGVLPQIAELSTIVRYNIPVVVFVHNNNSFFVLEEAMRKRHGISGSMELTNPDFVKLCRSFGIRAYRANTLRGLRRVFSKNVDWTEPVLIEFVDRTSSTPWS